MKINLSNAEKTALANYLAEERTKHMTKSLGIITLPDDYFKTQFEYYSKILKEKDDY